MRQNKNCTTIDRDVNWNWLLKINKCYEKYITHKEVTLVVLSWPHRTSYRPPLRGTWPPSAGSPGPPSSPRRRGICSPTPFSYWKQLLGKIMLLILTVIFVVFFISSWTSNNCYLKTRPNKHQNKNMQKKTEHTKYTISLILLISIFIRTRNE